MQLKEPKELTNAPAPSFYQLLYDPKKGKDLGMQPKRYARGGEEANSPYGVGVTEIKGKWLIPGRNRITAQEWDSIKTEPEVVSFLRQGVYRLITPNSNEGNLADFAEHDALELIEYTYDIEALELELLQEKRAVLLKRIKQQIKFLQEKANSSSISLAERG